MSKLEKYLESIYFNPDKPGSFEGIKTLYDIIKKEKKYKISYKQVKDWLESKKSYSQNKAVKRNFQRQKVIVSGIDAQHDADLGNLSTLAEANDGYKYFLAVIDIFSRYAWVEPLKDKSSDEIVKAYNKIISEGRKPKTLRTDAARDFTSKNFQKFLKQKNIHHFTTHNEKQANYVERFIKTLKSKIYRYIIQTNSERYIDKFQDFIKSYNNTIHSSIKIEPVNVNKNNEKKIWWEMYWSMKPYVKKKDKYLKRNFRAKKFKFKIGDRVRISYLTSSFQREYSSKWSSEIYQIYRRYLSYDIPKYKIKDWFNEKLEGTFNQHELQKVSKPGEDLFNINEVKPYRGKGRNKTVQVSWKGWPKKFNTILPASEIQQL